MPIFRILLVDDDVVMIELLSTVFELEGHTVFPVMSGEEALALLEFESPVDVILTDMQLPGIHGAELAAKLRALKSPATRLVGMSGSRPSKKDAAAFDAFLLKPFTLEEFASATYGSSPSSQPDSHENRHTVPDAKGALDESTFERLAAQLPGSQLRELYQLTLSDVAQRLERMGVSEAAGDLPALRREAHAIKGGCGMVGASELHHLAARLETGAPGDTPALVDFIPACDRLRRMLDERLC